MSMSRYWKINKIRVYELKIINLHCQFHLHRWFVYLVISIIYSVLICKIQILLRSSIVCQDKKTRYIFTNPHPRADKKKNHIDKGRGPADASQITGSGKEPPPIDSCIEKTKIKKIAEWRMFGKPRVVSHFRVYIEKREENRSPYFSVVQRAWIDRQIDRHFIQLLPADCHLVPIFSLFFSFFSLFFFLSPSPRFRFRKLDTASFLQGFFFFLPPRDRRLDRRSK